MKKLIYIAMAIFILIFALSCEEEEEEAVNLAGTWSGVSFGIDFLMSYDGIDLSCSSEVLQYEEACEEFPCNWDEETESCGPEALELFADNGGEVNLILNSDGTATWTEFWEESYYGYYGDYTYTDECASTGTWTASSGNINFTSTTEADMDDCNVFEAITENPVPYTTSGSDMTWTLPLSTVYGDYGNDDGYGSMIINWSK